MNKIYFLLLLTLTAYAIDAQVKTSKVEELFKSQLNNFKKRILQDVKKVEIVGSDPVPSVQKIYYKDLPKHITNVRFLGSGYNIYYGNPKSTSGLDPGFTNFPAVNLLYTTDVKQTLSKDFKTYIPLNTEVSRMSACSISYSSKAISSLSQYQDSLSVSVSVSGGFGAASFSASVDYKNVANSLSTSESLFIESNAKCTAYSVSLMRGQQSPGVHDYFNDALRELEALGENGQAYYNFFDEFGTHITDSVVFGSSYGFIYELSVSETKKLQIQSVDVEASASYFSVSASVKTSYQKEQEDKFKSAVSSWRSYSIGAPPDANNDVLQWATQSISNPMPVQISLISISQYLKNFTSAGKFGIAQQTFDNLVARFEKYSQTYCSERLLKVKAVSTCQNQNIKAPITIGQKPAASFIDTLVDGSTLVTFVGKKSNKYLTKRSSVAKVTIERNLNTPDQRFLLIKANEASDSYLIQQNEQKQCLQLINCNGNAAATYLQLAKCLNTDICQRFKFTISNATNQEIIISAERLKDKYLTLDSSSDNAGTSAAFWEMVNDDSKMWRLAAIL